MATTKKSRYIATLLLALPLIAVLSACGAADTRGDDGSSPDPQASQAPQFDSFEEYQLGFAECMRDKGIDMADPADGGQSIGQADDAFMEAAEACQTEMGMPPARESGSDNVGPSSEELRQQHLEIAECLREHGVDVPDPGPGEELAIPSDVPADAFETCAPQGVMGSTGGN
ncbi:hypothetical protein [Microbacterium cremeum]|uniref:hypothetical protein n=1 Tax=Microbacterium cremeum TaxID=2782169 RepID=UPI001889AAC4|nr:hypothetical protein [Microbacterium cremeum]